MCCFAFCIYLAECRVLSRNVCATDLQCLLATCGFSFSLSVFPKMNFHFQCLSFRMRVLISSVYLSRCVFLQRTSYTMRTFAPKQVSYVFSSVCHSSRSNPRDHMALCCEQTCSLFIIVSHSHFSDHCKKASILTCAIFFIVFVTILKSSAKQSRVWDGTCDLLFSVSLSHIAHHPLRSTSFPTCNVPFFVSISHVFIIFLVRKIYVSDIWSVLLFDVSVAKSRA